MKRGIATLSAALCLLGPHALSEEAQTVEVLAFNADATPGTALSGQQVRTRRVSRRHASGSVVKPENLEYLLGAALLTPVLAGDLVRWSMFDTDRPGSAESPCKRLELKGDARTQLARVRTAILRAQSEGK